MDKVEDEEIDSMYQDWLKYNEPGSEAAYPTSWEEAMEDLSDFPEHQQNQGREMEW